VETRPRADTTAIVGFFVVALVAIFGLEAFLRFARSADGWMFIRDFGLSKEITMAIQGTGALLAGLFGAQRVWHGTRVWQLDAGRGRIDAILQGALAAGSFFVALELLRTAW
jgi:hypothetical protein